MSVTLTTTTCRERDDYMNLANTNFKHLMTALGYDMAKLDWVGELDPADLLARIAKCLAAIAQGHGAEFTRSPRHTRIATENGCVELFDAGRDEQGMID